MLKNKRRLKVVQEKNRMQNFILELINITKNPVTK